LTFSKWEGLGNDFILIDGTPPDNAEQLAVRWCHRRQGIGADGLVFVSRNPARMVIYNSDGSKAQMCGNALRCLGAWLSEQGHLPLNQWLEVATDSGPRRLRVQRMQPPWVEVDMGQPAAIENHPPLLPIPEIGLPGHFVSMGNPHLVVLCPEGLPDLKDFERWGAWLSQAPFVPAGGINVEFAARRSDGLQLLVWERGAGPTQACGTGACAALVVAVRVGWLQGSAMVGLPGGDLKVDWNCSDGVLMAGPARHVFSGSTPRE